MEAKTDCQSRFWYAFYNLIAHDSEGHWSIRTDIRGGAEFRVEARRHGNFSNTTPFNWLIGDHWIDLHTLFRWYSQYVRMESAASPNEPRASSHTLRRISLTVISREELSIIRWDPDFSNYN